MTIPELKVRSMKEAMTRSWVLWRMSFRSKLISFSTCTIWSCQMQSPEWQWQGLLQCPQWSELGTVCFVWRDGFSEWKKGVELGILFWVFWQGCPVIMVLGEWTVECQSMVVVLFLFLEIWGINHLSRIVIGLFLLDVFYWFKATLLTCSLRSPYFH